MDLFIGNLPLGTSTKDLKTMVKNAINHRSILNFFFNSQKHEVECRVFEKETNHGLVNYGIVSIKPDRVCKLVAQRLPLIPLGNGEKIIVREYHQRSYSSERRAVNWRQKPWQHKERRINDRRKTLEHRVADAPAIEVGEIEIGGHRPEFSSR